MSTPGLSRADAIDRLLPQTQCTRCGYQGCRPYAEAIAIGEAPINRCPPGGVAGIRKLADLLGTAVLTLDAACGEEKPLEAAVIDESRCIGCTLCIAACPVDAIVGAPKQMHAVIAALCSGCELCIAPCPVDCISMVAASEPWNDERGAAARMRFDARNDRLERQQAAEERRLAELASAS